MRIVAVANLKGGVGKTTITHNLAGVLAERGSRVLLVDLDHQANLSSIYIPNLTESQEDGGLTRALFEHVPLSEVIRKTGVERIAIAPADLDLNLMDVRFNQDLDAHFLLADLLRSEDGYFDYALIDCPPHLGMAVRMALVAAHAYLIPLTADYWGYRGSQRIQDVVGKTRARANQDLKFLGYVASKIQPRTRIGQQMLDFFRDNLGDELAATHIRESVKYREAAEAGLPITTYLPTSDQAEDFRKLANDIDL